MGFNQWRYLEPNSTQFSSLLKHIVCCSVQSPPPSLTCVSAISATGRKITAKKKKKRKGKKKGSQLGEMEDSQRENEQICFKSKFLFAEIAVEIVAAGGLVIGIHDVSGVGSDIVG